MHDLFHDVCRCLGRLSLSIPLDFARLRVRLCVQCFHFVFVFELIIIMASYSSMFTTKKGLSVRELENIIANEWSDPDDDEMESQNQLSKALTIDIVVLPPDAVDNLTDTEDVSDEQMFCENPESNNTDDGLESVPEICGSTEMFIEYRDPDNVDEVPLSIIRSELVGSSRSEQPYTQALNIEPPKWRKRTMASIEQPIDLSEIAMKNLEEKYGKCSSYLTVLFLCCNYKTLNFRIVLAFAIVGAFCR